MMKNIARLLVLMSGFIGLPTGLVGCGGGGSNSPITNLTQGSLTFQSLGSNAQNLQLFTVENATRIRDRDGLRVSHSAQFNRFDLTLFKSGSAFDRSTSLSLPLISPVDPAVGTEFDLSNQGEFIYNEGTKSGVGSLTTRQWKATSGKIRVINNQGSRVQMQLIDVQLSPAFFALPFVTNQATGEIRINGTFSYNETDIINADV